MEFKELSLDEFNKLDESAQLKYHAEFADNRKAESVRMNKELVDLAKADGDNSEAIEAINKQLKELDFDRVESLEKSMRELGTGMQKLVDKTPELSISQVDEVNKWISDNTEEIKAMHKAGAGTIELTVKAVADMTTGSATNVGTVPNETGVQIAPPVVINLRLPIVDSLITTFPTTQAAYAYTESTPKDGDYTFLAEGASKAQIDFKIETRYATPVKTAAHEILTTESVQDIPNLQAIANDLLRKKHDLKRQSGILFGDGTGANPKGATVYARTFVAGGMASKLPAGSANIMDVINACVTDISTTHNYTDEESYVANIAMLNKVDFFLNFVAAKDDNNRPLYPMASLFNRVVIGGVLIVPFDDIATGKVFVADLTKYNVSRYVGYTVRIGWINDQLITNKFTMVGESRFHAFVKNLDEQAFIYDTIATIVTAIEV
jgi:hypothetical protein